MPSMVQASGAPKSRSKKKVTGPPPEAHNPLSDSAPGGERVVVSRAGQATRLRPRTTSPNPTPCLRVEAGAAGPAVLTKDLARHQPSRRPNRKLGRGDRTGLLGMRPCLLSTAQN